MEKTELERLREENELLRSEYLKLKNQNQNTKKPMSKGCIAGLIVLVGMLVAIPVMSIIAAIALPAYQQFNVKAEFHSQCVKINDLALQVKTAYESGGGFPYDLNSIDDVEKAYGLSFEGKVSHFEYVHDSNTATFSFYYQDGKLRDRTLTLQISCEDLQCEPTIKSSDSSLVAPAFPY